MAVAAAPKRLAKKLGASEVEVFLVPLSRGDLGEGQGGAPRVAVAEVRRLLARSPPCTRPERPPPCTAWRSASDGHASAMGGGATPDEGRAPRAPYDVRRDDGTSCGRAAAPLRCSICRERAYCSCARRIAHARDA